MTYAPCPKILYNDRISWCIKAGAPCIGCGEQGWTDKFAGFYERCRMYQYQALRVLNLQQTRLALLQVLRLLWASQPMLLPLQKELRREVRSNGKVSDRPYYKDRRAFKT